MVTHDMGWRCDRWEPRVRPEPTSTVHAQSGKMRLVGLAVITSAIVILLGTKRYTRLLVTGKPFV